MERQVSGKSGAGPWGAWATGGDGWSAGMPSRSAVRDGMAIVLAVAVGAVVLAVGSAGVAGCSVVGDSGSALARSGVATTIGGGLAWLAARDGGEGAEAVRDAAGRMRAIVDGTILPLLAGADEAAGNPAGGGGGRFTRGLADRALALLEREIPPGLVPFARKAMGFVLEKIGLPPGDGDEIPATARPWVVAFFRGVSDGCSTFLGGRAEAPRSVPRAGVRGGLSWDR